MIRMSDAVTIDEPTSPNFGKVGKVVAMTETTITIAPCRTLAPTGRGFRLALDGSNPEYRRSIVRRTCDRPSIPDGYWTQTD